MLATLLSKADGQLEVQCSRDGRTHVAKGFHTIFKILIKLEQKQISEKIELGTDNKKKSLKKHEEPFVRAL